MNYVALATEDALSEAVGKRLLTSIEHPMEANLYFRQNGFGYLRKNMQKWCNLAIQQPVVLLTDLDQHVCPHNLIDTWLGGLIRPNNLVFRVAVKEVESWLLADHDAMRQLIGNKGRLPPDPDTLENPKDYLLKLAKNAHREIRKDLVKEDGAASSQGIGYNARLTDVVDNLWSPQRASHRSPSLIKAFQRLDELGQRLAAAAL